MNSAVDISDHPAAIAAASNRLTAEWAGRVKDGTSTVLSGAGVWPLLGLLALGADGDCRAELAEAYGLDPALGGTAAREFITVFDRAPALRAALGLWYKSDLTIRRTWLDELPPATHGKLTGDLKADKQHRDAWAKEHTDGLIEQMPVALSPSTVLILASAIMVKTTWRQEFQDVTHRVGAGPWAGRAVPALTRPLGPDMIRVVDGGDGTGPITTVAVEGEDDIDVLLFLGGPEVPAGRVLRAGIDALGAPDPHRLGTAATSLLDGVGGDEPIADPRVPGVVVRTVQSAGPEPTAVLTTPRFTIKAGHDLLAESALFGLEAASDADRARFPGMSPEPLVVSSANQDAMAEFSAKGFKAAAVTVIAMARSMAMHRTEHRSRRFEVSYDRPFGFAAVHRTSGLIIVAGWVAEV